MTIHRRAANIRTIFAVIIVAGLVALVSLKVSESVGQSRGDDAFDTSYSHPLDNVGGNLLDGEPIAMP